MVELNFFIIIIIIIIIIILCHVLPPVQAVGVEVGRQDNIWGRDCSGNFPWREIVWQRCISNPPLFWREIILVTSNGLNIRKEHERRSEEILERCRGRRRREHFNENQHKAESDRARNKRLIYNG